LAPIVVVTREAGSDVNEIRTALGGQDVKWVENSIWARGMGSSLRAGLDFLLRADESLDAVMLLVCDQPLVTAAHLRSLVDEITNSGKSMVAAGYDGTVGVPAIVSRNYFNELASLPEDGGAKVLFRRFPEAVAVMPLPEAKVDVDNPAAYRFLLRGGAT
jgi:molybdenum cofactor cytidylyltransferase